MGRGTFPLLPIIVVIVLVVVGWRLSPLSPGPPLPPNATALDLRTPAVHLLPNAACPTALLAPIRITSGGNQLIVLSAQTAEVIDVVWPSGWVAWQIGGRAILVDRDGAIVVREGEVVADRFGGGEDADGAFIVCEIGW